MLSSCCWLFYGRYQLSQRNLITPLSILNTIPLVRAGYFDTLSHRLFQKPLLSNTFISSQSSNRYRGEKRRFWTLPRRLGLDKLTHWIINCSRNRCFWTLPRRLKPNIMTNYATICSQIHYFWTLSSFMPRGVAKMFQSLPLSNTLLPSETESLMKSVTNCSRNLCFWTLSRRLKLDTSTHCVTTYSESHLFWTPFCRLRSKLLMKDSTNCSGNR